LEVENSFGLLKLSTPYLGLYPCLSHPTYKVNYFPISTHKHKKMDGLKRKKLFKCHALG